MISQHWQDIVVALVALGALVYYVRRRLRSRGADCEGCPSGTCTPDRTSHAQDSQPTASLIAVEMLSRRGSKQG